MPVRTTDKTSKGYGSSKVVDAYSLEFSSTRRTGGGTNAPIPTAYVSSNLLMYVDAAKSDSYSGSGTNWNDLSGNGRNMTLTNGPTFTSGTPSYFTFDGTNDYVTLGTPSLLNQVQVPLTICIWAKANSLGTWNTLWGVYKSTTSS